MATWPRTRSPCGGRGRVAVRALGVLGSALIALTLATGSASATIVDRHNDSGPYEFTAWDCGYPMQVEGVFSDDIQVRVDKKNADIAYVTTRHSFKETWTAADGRSFTLAGHKLYKDIKAKRVAGQLYAFTFHIPGQPVTVTDSSGKVVAQDRGNVSFYYTIDFANGIGHRHWIQDLGTSPDLRHRSVPDRRAALAPLGSRDSAQYLTQRPIGSTAFHDGLRRVPPAELHARRAPRARSSCSSTDPARAAMDQPRRCRTSSVPGSRNTSMSAAGRPTARSSSWRPSISTREPSISRPATVRPGVGPAACNSSMTAETTRPSYCTTPHEVARLHRLRRGALQRRPDAGVRDRAVVRRLWDLGIPGELMAPTTRSRPPSRSPATGVLAPQRDYCALDATPIWAFHGLLDDAVNPLGSIEPMTALAAVRASRPTEAMLTSYPDRDHNSWDPAYGGAMATTSTPGCSSSRTP